MAAITVTPANVVPVSSQELGLGTAGGTITAGMALYRDAADNKLKAAQANAATTDEVVGIALHGASNNQPLQYQRGGVINIGGTVVVGTIYVLGPGAAGAIAPAGDLGATNYVSVIGVAITAANLRLGIVNSGVAVPE